MLTTQAALRIVGYVIVSTDGMISDAAGQMTDTLVIEADQVFYQTSLSQARLIVHGRNSGEGGPQAAERSRVIVTTRVGALAPAETSPLAWLWNPLGISFPEALRSLGIDAGDIAIVGGTDVFELFLAIGYDAFYLTRSARGALPGGRPVFRGVPRRSPEEILSAAGLQPRSKPALSPDATLVVWRRIAAR